MNSDLPKNPPTMAQDQDCSDIQDSTTLLLYQDNVPLPTTFYQFTSCKQHVSHGQVLHGKNYQGEEDQERKAIFEENLKKIVQHNLEYDLGMHSYYLGINKYSDWSRQEINKNLNGLVRSNKIEGKPYEPSEDMKLPSSVDWRDKGYVTEVKDQGHCGSCWAFSTTGALEGQNYRKTGKLVSLSEQDLIDCSVPYHNSGCDGGDMTLSYLYVINNGIDTEESYPYKAKNGVCHHNDSTIGATCNGFVDIPRKDEKKLKHAVATIGPISVGIDASSDAFHQYKGGVLDVPDCSSFFIGHAVLIVGYGTENGKDYWLVKNSWGKSWGDHGYIKMSRNKHNQCGIASAASYPWE
ncbi:hypothetical protein LAZ67_1002886 [Cordylochernes scorpioides]|uniref:Cathepsin L n=1 Tax=Cordylochernes scorpioides TaxID=51811 RepID=A0ABY6JX64_9ARAC|nr:hypothetical protein LAZ67_1002886 [Cordylochernes scorpioides]